MGRGSERESERCAGQTVNYSWQFIDRDRFSQSKKRQEVRRSEKLAAALAVFSPNQHVQVVPVSLPPPVTRLMSKTLELDDEDKFRASVAELSKIYPRHRNDFSEICDEIANIRFSKTCPVIVIYCLEDNTFKILL